MNRFHRITAAAVGVLLAFAMQNASAESWFQFEAGVGITSAVKLGDGMYFSRGFSHSTPNGSYGGRVGVVMNVLDGRPRSFVPGLRIHAFYANFGKVRWSSVNPQDAADFDGTGTAGGYNIATQTCNDNNCGAMRRFDSTGGIQAVAVTLEPFWNVGYGFQLGLEAGPALYRSTWVSVATALSDGPFGPAGTQETLQHSPHVQLGAIAGVSVVRGPFAVRLDYLFAPPGRSTAKDVPAGIRGSWMLSMNYAF